MAILQIYADSKGQGRCRSCGAAVTWAELTSGRRHPFNGEIVAVRTQGSILEGRVIEHVDTDITSSHFATCNDPKRWRKPR